MLYCKYRYSVTDDDRAVALRQLVEYVDCFLDKYIERYVRYRDMALDAKQDMLVSFLERLVRGFDERVDCERFEVELEREFRRVYLRLRDRERYVLRRHREIDLPVDNFVGGVETHGDVENRIFLNELKGLVGDRVLGRIRFSGLAWDACRYILECVLGERRVVEYHLRRYYGLKNPSFYVDYIEVLLRESLYDFRSQQYHVGRNACWIEDVFC